MTKVTGLPAVPPPRAPKYVEPPQPLPPLPRPVLLVKGGSRSDMGLPEVVHYLTSGGNNHFGGVYGVDRRQEFEDDFRRNPGNVFTMRYTRHFGSIEHNAGELRQAIEDLRRLTGADEIDVVAESKGSLEIRQHLKEGHDGVRNVVLLVPVSHGIPLAGDLARAAASLLEKIPGRPDRVFGYPTDADTLRALKSFSVDWSVGPVHGNPLAHGLNSQENRARESAALNSLTVLGGGDRRLLQGGLPGLPFPSMRGDHSVPRWSSFLPHAENFFYSGALAEHGKVKEHPEALAKLAEALVQDGKVTRDEHHQARAPHPNAVAARSLAWTGSFVGRLNMARHALAGTQPGTAGMVLGGLGAGLAVVDGTLQLADVVRGEAPRLRGAVGVLGKFAQAAGVGLAMAGAGWPGAALVAAGIVASTVTS